MREGLDGLNYNWAGLLSRLGTKDISMWTQILS